MYACGCILYNTYNRVFEYVPFCCRRKCNRIHSTSFDRLIWWVFHHRDVERNGACSEFVNETVLRISVTKNMKLAHQKSRSRLAIRIHNVCSSIVLHADVYACNKCLFRFQNHKNSLQLLTIFRGAPFHVNKYPTDKSLQTPTGGFCMHFSHAHCEYWHSHLNRVRRATLTTEPQSKPQREQKKTAGDSVCMLLLS